MYIALSNKRAQCNIVIHIFKWVRVYYQKENMHGSSSIQFSACINNVLNENKLKCKLKKPELMTSI